MLKSGKLTRNCSVAIAAMIALGVLTAMSGCDAARSYNERRSDQLDKAGDYKYKDKKGDAVQDALKN